MLIILVLYTASVLQESCVVQQSSRSVRQQQHTTQTHNATLSCLSVLNPQTT